MLITIIELIIFNSLLIILIESINNFKYYKYLNYFCNNINIAKIELDNYNNKLITLPNNQYIKIIRNNIYYFSINQNMSFVINKINLDPILLYYKHKLNKLIKNI